MAYYSASWGGLARQRRVFLGAAQGPLPADAIWPSAWLALSAGALPEAETLPDAELPAPPEQAAQARAMDRASARAAIRFHVLCFKRFTPSGWF